jgi:hypothetical protein
MATEGHCSSAVSTPIALHKHAAVADPPPGHNVRPPLNLQRPILFNWRVISNWHNDCFEISFPRRLLHTFPAVGLARTYFIIFRITQNHQAKPAPDRLLRRHSWATVLERARN